MAKYTSCTLKRQLQIYPPDQVRNMFIAYTEDNEMSNSEAGTLMIKEFFKNMPEHLRERYKNMANKRTSKNSY